MRHLQNTVQGMLWQCELVNEGLITLQSGVSTFFQTQSRDFLSTSHPVRAHLLEGGAVSGRIDQDWHSHATLPFRKWLRNRIGLGVYPVPTYHALNITIAPIEQVRIIAGSEHRLHLLVYGNPRIHHPWS